MKQGVDSDLAATLARLEELAGRADAGVEDEALPELRALQYSLHRASELMLGIAAPAGAEVAHAELRSALAQARDATGEVADALEEDSQEAVITLVHEWRGALFRVRLARHLLLARPAQAPVAPDPAQPFPWTALAGALLVAAGALAFTSGAVLSLWQLWAAGLALVAGGFVVYRP